MENKRLLAVTLLSSLILGTAARGADKNDSTWLSLLYSNGGSSMALASPFESNPLDSRLDTATVTVAQSLTTPPQGSAELTGSLVAFGLLYRVLRRRRAL